jgi:hypothetical protein
MTFALLRAGLPNSIVAAALAALPIVALALSPPQHAPQASAQSVEVIVAAGSEPATNGDRAVPD